MSPWVGWMLFVSILTTTFPVDALEKTGSTQSVSHSTSISTPSQRTTEGHLASIDLNKGELEVLTSDGTHWKIQTNANTKTIHSSGQLAELKDLKIGERVKVRHRDQTERQVAKTVEAL